jgi:tartrate dehydrogenase/decarboxylase/D-malate dehydrogenase
MLDFFGEKDWGTRILMALEKVLMERKVLSADFGGTASTEMVGTEIRKQLASI